jgi:hypothetical protein
MNIYIACALTHVPRNHFLEYTAFIHNLASKIRESVGHDVKYALVNSDPQLARKPMNERARLCYLWDAKMVHDADVVIAECSFPSIGLGIELQIAAEKEIPVILFFRDFNDNQALPVHYKNPDDTEHELQIGEGFVSLMALGLPTIFRIHRYTGDKEAIEQICDAVKLLQQ